MIFARKIANPLKNDRFVVSFMHLELRREHSQMAGRREKARQGTCDRIVKITCFHGGGDDLFQPRRTETVGRAG